MIPNELWYILEQEIGTSFDRSRKIAQNILRLNELFTTKREIFNSSYLEKNQATQAYVSYYLPLNFLKFQRLLNSFETIIVKSSPQKILDFGCGPGTATLAYLYFYHSKKLSQKIPLEIFLVESQPKILGLAVRLIEALAKELKLKVSIKTSSDLKTVETGFDFSFFGNVVNEISNPQNISKALALSEGYCLFLEPSHRVSSQKLIRLREKILKNKSHKILGPCLHQEMCPLNLTNNWCHFSSEIKDPRWEKFNSYVFRNNRQWLKYSYLFIQKTNQPFELWNKREFRIIGDLHPTGGMTSATQSFKHGKGIERKNFKQLAIDLCQPKSKKVLMFKNEKFEKIRNLRRGNIVELNGDKIVKIIRNEPAGLTFVKPAEPR